MINSGMKNVRRHLSTHPSKQVMFICLRTIKKGYLEKRLQISLS